MLWFQGNFFSGLDDGLLARAEAMAVVDMGKSNSGHQLMKPEGLYGHTPDFTMGGHGGPPRSQMPPMHHPSFGPADAMFEPLTPSQPPGMPLGPVARHTHDCDRQCTDRNTTVVSEWHTSSTETRL